MHQQCGTMSTPSRTKTETRQPLRDCTLTTSELTLWTLAQHDGSLSQEDCQCPMHASQKATVQEYPRGTPAVDSSLFCDLEPDMAASIH